MHAHACVEANFAKHKIVTFTKSDLATVVKYPDCDTYVISIFFYTNACKEKYKKLIPGSIYGFGALLDENVCR